MELDRPDSRSIGPRGPAQAVAAFQGAGNVQVTNANISVVGGDSHSHTHVHCHGTPDFKDLKAFLDLISNFRKIQQDTLAKATPGTVKWLFVSKFFSVWWNGSGNIKVLWGSGIPGAGKTILASLVVAEAEQRAANPKDQICVAYFYMRYSEHGEVTVRAVLEVFAKQILERHEDLLKFAEKVYACHIREGTRPTEDQLLELLQQFTEHTKITFYILDALDEAPVDIQYDLVEKLTSLNARIFITSRPMQDMQADFPEAHCFKIAAQDRDLDLHIAQKLQRSPRLRALLDQGRVSVKEQVISTVKAKCGGMFLHASLQLDAPQRCLSVHSAMQTLDRFPTKIEDVYRQTWRRILDQDLEHATLAKHALVWVLYAKRSLTIEELLRVIATCPETYGFEEERLIPESTLIDLCYGLITVDDKSRLVRLVHYTAKQPMEDLLRIPFPRPHSLLAAICIARLTDCGFQNASINSTMELDKALRADPLLDYAYDSWIFHARESLDLEVTASRMATFVAGCRTFPITGKGRNSYHGTFDILNSFHMVAFYDLPNAFARPHDPHDANAQTPMKKRTPLHLACLQGHQAAVQSLLCLSGIFVNVMDSDGETALLLACKKDHTDIVKLLLAHPDTEVHLADKRGHSPLAIACNEGYEGIIKLLLAHPRVNVNSVGCDGDTGLICASRQGFHSVVKLLLAHSDINANLTNQRGDTSLIVAARNNHAAIVKLLLASPRIRVNSANRDGCTALLLAACTEGGEDIVKSLLAHASIDVNHANQVGGTPLVYAARQGNERNMALLLAHPAILVNLLTGPWGTALIAASSKDNNEHGVKLLLSHPNIEVNLPDKHGDTALIRASQNGLKFIVELLLAVPDIEVNSKNDYGVTAIGIAAHEGHEDVVQMLLAVPGIDIAVESRDGRTAMSVAFARGHHRVVRALREFEGKQRVSQGVPRLWRASVTSGNCRRPTGTPNTGQGQ